jgi:hypothetical protein
MITYLLLKYLAYASSEGWTVGQLMAVIPILLFLQKDIWLILNKLKIDPSRYAENPLQLEFNL